MQDDAPSLTGKGSTGSRPKPRRRAEHVRAEQASPTPPSSTSALIAQPVVNGIDPERLALIWAAENDRWRSREAQLSEKTVALVEAEARAKGAEQEVGRLEQRLARALEKKDRLRTELSDLRSHSLSEFRILEQRIIDAEARSETLQEQLALSAAEKAALCDQLARDKFEIERLASERARLQAQLGLLEREMDAVRDLNRGKDETLAALMREVEAARSEASDRRLDNEALLAAASDREGRLQDQRAELDELQAALTAAKEAGERNGRRTVDLEAELAAERSAAARDREALHALAAHAATLTGTALELDRGVLGLCIALEAALDRLAIERETARTAVASHRGDLLTRLGRAVRGPKP